MDLLPSTIGKWLDVAPYRSELCSAFDPIITSYPLAFPLEYICGKPAMDAG
ncbi:hypothethical protein (plasmid) [Ralstonia solanacearum Po82]|uniref:Hypothethical protein n=1 Tax=Ralstonia solanacearum (strain Po82) TaxID=1031711 RepID=F6GB84_RALS8|nr:hypothethical protein [Ralstonia solanacearum Po82]